MTSNIYVIDSSSLIELHHHNPMDVYPTIWQHLEALIKETRVVAPREVLDEIVIRDDKLAEWVKVHKKLFLDLTYEQIKILKDTLEEYSSLLREDRRYDADAFVITLAKTMASQKTLTNMKIVVITEEKARGNKINIPFV